MQPPTKQLHRFSQQLAKTPPVALIAVNGAPLMASGGDMMPGARPFDAWTSGHAANAHPAQAPGQGNC
jgi:hypothetical protein